ncbi:MAG: large subunit ribosomal protein [Solirubrobacteraceae bacterium]|nr:large subunit ribosomal protein [Solirubrobacteraceae bacterium]
MNREQKSAAIAEIADQIQESGAVFAVDFRGISVPQAADVRTRLRDADASFRVVKNTLTERAADRVGAEGLKPLLEGPTALTFVRGDVATAAKAIATFSRETQLLTFKGGIMDGDVLDGEQILAISRLPSREVLYGQLVGVVASPITGVVRTLNALIAGVAIALDQVREKKESGEIPAADAPAASAAETPAETATEPVPADEQPAADATPAADAAAPAADAAAETPGEGERGAETETPDQDAEPPSEPASPEQPAEGAPDTSTSDETTDQQADASA